MLGEHAERGVDDGPVGLLAARGAGQGRAGRGFRAGRGGAGVGGGGRGRGGGAGFPAPPPPGPGPGCSLRTWSGMLCSTTVLAFAADMDLAFHPGLGGDTRRDLSGIRHHAGPELSSLVPGGFGLPGRGRDR